MTGTSSWALWWKSRPLSPFWTDLLRYVDFVNVGTNDLMQYLLAVDRNNKKVAVHFNVLHPSVIATIAQIVSVCKRFDKQLCICGEAAAVKESIFLFIGMGVDHISMVPSAIPGRQAVYKVRELCRCANGFEDLP